MNRIAQAFCGKKAFIGFLTAGDPTLEKSEEYILEMARAGADLIEIGIPFSDPVAEGEVIEKADQRALAAGTTTDGVLELAARVRKKLSIPLVFLTYINPVFTYGYERFFQRCEESGIDGIIIPDLPFEERDEIAGIAKKHGVIPITMIAPTSEERISKLAQAAEGFIYLVSSMGVTGVRSEIVTDLPKIVSKIREVTEVPVAVGFGIARPEQAKAIAAFADGAIVGSRIVSIIQEYGQQAHKPLYEYVKEMKGAVSDVGAVHESEIG